MRCKVMVNGLVVSPTQGMKRATEIYDSVLLAMQAVEVKADVVLIVAPDDAKKEVLELEKKTV